MTQARDNALTAPVLRRALATGARRVIAGRELLNRINVFPVADGDTGNNLASTLGGLLNGALRRRSRHVGELLHRIGQDAIDGARGNSGAILAQFLHGVAEHVQARQATDSAVLDVAALAAAVPPWGVARATRWRSRWKAPSSASSTASPMHSTSPRGMPMPTRAACSQRH